MTIKEYNTIRRAAYDSALQIPEIADNKKLNCKNCGYKYCPFRGSDREIFAFFCEDYEPTEKG